MAGPHVVGVVALLWSAAPDLIGDIEATEEILAASARPFTGSVSGIFSEEEMAELPAQLDEDSLLMQLLAPAAPSDSCLALMGDDPVPNNATGYGIVDAYAAVEMALAD